MEDTDVQSMTKFELYADAAAQLNLANYEVLILQLLLLSLILQVLGVRLVFEQSDSALSRMEISILYRHDITFHRTNI
jgi:hypothetical protein